MVVYGGDVRGKGRGGGSWRWRAAGQIKHNRTCKNTDGGAPPRSGRWGCASATAGRGRTSPGP
jgi:hypothetical protein